MIYFYKNKECSIQCSKILKKFCIVMHIYKNIFKMLLVIYSKERRIVILQYINK